MINFPYLKSLSLTLIFLRTVNAASHGRIKHKPIQIDIFTTDKTAAIFIAIYAQ